MDIVTKYHGCVLEGGGGGVKKRGDVGAIMVSRTLSSAPGHLNPGSALDTSG